MASMSDMGRVREINEDSFCCAELSCNMSLLIVADGMGGHNAGEVASKIAVKTLSQYVIENIKAGIPEDELVEVLQEGIQKANSDIYQESLKNSAYSGMGTTVTSAIVSQDQLVVGHVGDSRAYILKHNKLKRITRDHSLVEELIMNGTITEAQAMHHPQKNIITRALGVEDSVDIDIERLKIDTGDMVLLCTDGLTNMLEESKIEDILLKFENPDDAVQKMVEMANEAGGQDNITVLLAKAMYPEEGVRQ